MFSFTKPLFLDTFGITSFDQYFGDFVGTIFFSQQVQQDSYILFTRKFFSSSYDGVMQCKGGGRAGKGGGKGGKGKGGRGTGG